MNNTINNGPKTQFVFQQLSGALSFAVQEQEHKEKSNTNGTDTRGFLII